MKLRNINYKQILREIIFEEILKHPTLNEIFDSPPFKTEFIFNDNKCKAFTDGKGNMIQVIFHKMVNDYYEVDFTVNGNSYENTDVDYSFKDYTSLISTVFKCMEQFIKEFSPQGLYIEGEDSFTKQDKGKKGQKNIIYKYALKQITLPTDYKMLTNEYGGVQILK